MKPRDPISQLFNAAKNFDEYSESKEDLGELASLIKDVNINHQDENGETALILAAVRGHQKLAQLLIDAKADPDIPSKEGKTALYWAVHRNQCEIASDLIKKAKAKPDIQTEKDGETPLMLAALFGRDQMVHDLITVAKANPDLQTRFGKTALMYAANCGRTKITHDLVVNARAKLDITNSDGNSALDEALYQKQLHTANFLLDFGALIHNHQNFFNTLLKEYDQREPGVLMALKHLYKQLSTSYTPKIFKQVSTKDKDFYKEVADYLGKLEKLTQLYQEKYKNAGTETSPLFKCNFFYPNEIDEVLSLNGIHTMHTKRIR